ncbi:MAG: transglycosylase SLT domain-containing protein [Alphaproteobacteria bacterium]|nr:transglycosylase SLT domain-containing protein [Alphaproteobacteria bacterium]
MDLPAEASRPRRGGPLRKILACALGGAVAAVALPALAGAVGGGPQPVPVKRITKVKTTAAATSKVPDAPRVIRILVPYSKTLFFYDRGKEMGVLHDMGVSLEKWANDRPAAEGQKGGLKVVFVPVTEDRLLPDLEAGLGDIAAGGISAPSGGESDVDLAGQIASDSGAAIVYRKGGDAVSSLDSLSGRRVVIHGSSPSYPELRALSDRMVAEGREPIRFFTAPEELQDEDLLQMVDAGLVHVAVVDRYVAAFWSQVLDGIAVNSDLLDKGGSEFVWAVRKDRPNLKRLVDGFTARHGAKPGIGEDALKKYLANGAFIADATSQDEMEKFHAAYDMFKKYGDAYDVDHLMMMALGYQESRLNQQARNPNGPVGMMQMMPATASTDAVGIKGIDKDAGRNVEAAAKYLRYIADSYLDDPGIDKMNRTLMAFVGYNAGPKNLELIRESAEKSGLNPNVWFNNVELAAARKLGRKSVEYISNIYKYYTAYRMAVGDPSPQGQPIKDVEKAPADATQIGLIAAPAK